MQTQLAPQYQSTPEGQAAEAILRKCVHCGFCTATCPTYQLLGDELDGPRGRIYLIKQVLEGETPTRATQQHLDRCLTCRNCETTCPSGVQYGRLIDIGRELVEQQVTRPTHEQALRWVLKNGLTSAAFGPAMKLGQQVRALLPQVLKDKVPKAQPAGAWPKRQHARQVILLMGCVQPSMSPNINTATARVLDALGIECLTPMHTGCCGAIKQHLNDAHGALDDVRRNIDAWWPALSQGQVEAIVVNASGCGVMVKDYGHVLAHDPVYADKAARVSALARDVSEYLASNLPALQGMLDTERVKAQGALVFHPPCTLQHGLKLSGVVEGHLRTLGFDLQAPPAEAHWCCGSAGTYSVLQPALSQQLKQRKLGHLQARQPQAILSANIGCITHLQSGTDTPVRHWIESVDACLKR
jgi:glycolate oxidase iron-sulfur subunit